jgi:hypothetical protein
VAVALFGFAVSAAAAPPDGGFVRPIDCEPGRTCWIVNYPDTATGPARGSVRVRPGQYLRAGARLGG